jgi:hypothetical protein
MLFLLFRHVIFSNEAVEFPGYALMYFVEFFLRTWIPCVSFVLVRCLSREREWFQTHAKDLSALQGYVRPNSVLIDIKLLVY